MPRAPRATALDELSSAFAGCEPSAISIRDHRVERLSPLQYWTATCGEQAYRCAEGGGTFHCTALNESGGARHARLPVPELDDYDVELQVSGQLGTPEAEPPPAAPRPTPTAVGSIDVISPNVYGEVWVDDRYYGTGPLRVRDVAAGDREITIEIRVDGRVRRSKRVRLRPNEHRVITLI